MRSGDRTSFIYSRRGRTDNPRKNRDASIGIAGFCPLCAVVEGVGGEEKEDVKEEGDATGEGLFLAEEEDGRCRGEEEEVEQEQERLLPCAVAVNADSSHYAEDIVEDHEGDVQCG